MQLDPEKHAGQLHERQLLNVVDDLCRFILHEVVNVKGNFFDETQDLATNDKYLSLRELSGTNSGTVNANLAP